MSVIKYILTITITILDLLIKYLVDKHITYIEILPNISLRTTYNYGISFNMLDNKTYLIIILSILLLGLFIYMEKDYQNIKYHNILFGLIYGGILGNLINRIITGYVIDYISIYYFPIFNLADICICVGIFFLIIGSVRNDSRRR